MKSQTLIAVANVRQSSNWYQSILGCESAHGGDEYERLIMPGEDEFFLQLHTWNAHDHPNLGDPGFAPHGYGVLLWFLVPEFDAAIECVHKLNANIIEHPHINKRANQRECWLKDPDDYIVVLSCEYGDI